MFIRRGCVASVIVFSLMLVGCGSSASQQTAKVDTNEEVTPAASDQVRDAGPEVSAGQDAEQDSSKSDPAGAEPDSETPAEPADDSTETGADKTDAEGSDSLEEAVTSADPAEKTDREGSESSIDVALEVPPERFVLLAEGGPVIVDVVLHLDGDAHVNALQELVEKALKAADEDGDGTPTWEEVADSDRFRYGQFGNLAVENDYQRGQLMRMYDRNSDGIVDREELPRFLTRNVGGSRSFSLRSANEYRNINRSRSHLRKLLDVDRDGAITHEEAVESTVRILSEDANDDEIVTLDDLKPTLTQMAAQMSNRRRTTEPDTALHLKAENNWGRIKYDLEEVYSFGDETRADDWPMVPQLFAALDKDNGGTISQFELAALAEVDPHLLLSVDFGEQEGGNAQPKVELVKTSPDIQEAIVETNSHGQRLSLVLTHTELEFFVNEDPALNNYEQLAQTQLMLLDGNQNGYLEADEVPDQLPGLNAPFEALDGDSDAMVTKEELAEFLSRRQAAYRGQVRARAADFEDALFSALDTDGDGRLDAREIYRCPERLAELDKNTDQKLQSHEIPGSMVVGFIRGNPQQDNTLFVVPTGIVTREQQAPRWFLGMDANGDGEIGSNEFLGDDAKFQELDRNADGFVSQEEAAEAAE